MPPTLLSDLLPALPRWPLLKGVRAIVSLYSLKSIVFGKEAPACRGSTRP